MNVNIRQGISNIPEICFQLGIKNVIICPGSRNAPLIIAFAKYQKLKSFSFTDERSAAYVALGMAQHNLEPVALICTSGTAALNFAPAIAEAYYQRLPLIVFTADRPAEWIDQADGQAIHQNYLYANNIKASFILPVETANANDLWYCNRVVSEAIQNALQEPLGPVHINVPLREPLYLPLPAIQPNIKIGRLLAGSIALPEFETENIKNLWKANAKKLVVIGFMNHSEANNKLIAELASDSGTVVIAENLSNVFGNNIIYTPEQLVASLNDFETELFQPNLLVTMGGFVISKRLKQFIRKHPPTDHWHVDISDSYTDTYQNVSQRIKLSVNEFLKIVTQVKTEVETNYASIFEIRNQKLIESSNLYFSKAAFSDIPAMGQILKLIPGNSIVHLANSTPVRFAQYFSTRSDIIYYANRGTSGIDGSISAGIGNAVASQKQTFVISGDLAFIYDSNALWNNYINNNFRIIVINNGGGNIFKLIDTSKEIESIQHFFETPHKVNIRALAEAFGIKWFYCNSYASLQEQFEKLITWNGPTLLEVETTAEKNVSVFNSYYNSIKQSIK